MNDAPLSKRTLILLLLFFGIAVYSNTFQAPFYFDDFRQIVNNFAFRPPFSIERIWQPLPSRLIANISFAMQYSFTGTAPWGFHLVNLLIHLLSSLAVFETTRCILRTPAIEHEIPAPQQNLFAFFTALFFAVHPLQTEAITYIVQRYTSLATLFYITALLMYLKARLEHPKFYVLALFFTILAALSRSPAIKPLSTENRKTMRCWASRYLNRRRL